MSDPGFTGCSLDPRRASYFQATEPGQLEGRLGPGEVKAGTSEGDRVLEGLLGYAAETESSRFVYHAPNHPDEPSQ
jgi:hypothetical protein